MNGSEWIFSHKKLYEIDEREAATHQYSWWQGLNKRMMRESEREGEKKEEKKRKNGNIKNAWKRKRERK